jgi:coproporphyrinogen III oxidase-like Fe-S oxidoreductase
MGLRLREGIDVARYQALSGRALRRRQIDELAADGFIAEDASGRLRVTPEGAPLLDTIVADLAA